ncbi:hypothetical protein NBH00_20435 [Paraconexibacter antarcticus]|uniref:DoxX family protein n=1 Tax=Paraconexibacter antarcticus TaxID=2949664 RepID=A0ABY5DNU4_9ACTN|nr:hypothetical protein [Paraconexibacter antarcticus]UTI63698.1 hypothetical protein NBH00_20435 [Paraconexibacter antarcticus]
MRLLPTRRAAPDLVGGLMITVGSLHFVVPGMMAEQIPAWIPFKRELVYVSGVVEVACGVGLRRRAPWAGPLAAATLAAIWPANIQMALDAGTGRNRGLMDDRRLMWARVPLQLPLIWGALRARRPA